MGIAKVISSIYVGFEKIYVKYLLMNIYMTFSEMMKQHISPILMKTEIEYKKFNYDTINCCAGDC